MMSLSLLVKCSISYSWQNLDSHHQIPFALPWWLMPAHMNYKYFQRDSYPDKNCEVWTKEERSNKKSEAETRFACSHTLIKSETVTLCKRWTDNDCLSNYIHQTPLALYPSGPFTIIPTRPLYHDTHQAPWPWYQSGIFSMILIRPL